MELPTEKSKPKEELKDYLILLYGRAKVGKSTLAAQFEEPLFLFFEPGGRSLSIYQKTMASWKDFKEAISLIKSSNFKTIVVDTVDAAYEAAMAYVCKEMGIDHPQDKGYAKAWNAIDREFSSTMSKLGMTGRGIVLISHAKDKDIEQPDGSVREMTGPSLANQGMRWADRNADLFAFYYYGKNGKRYIRVKGSDTVVAGSRIDGHFLNINKFWAGNSPQEAYKNLIDAFENKLVEEATNERKTTQSNKSNGVFQDGQSKTTLEGSKRRGFKIRPASGL